MRKGIWNGLIVAVAFIAIGAQAIPLCAPCCSPVQAAAPHFTIVSCCVSAASISCPIADTQRLWLQGSPAPAWSVASLPLGIASAPARTWADSKLAVTTFFLPASSRQVSLPLLV